MEDYRFIEGDKEIQYNHLFNVFKGMVEAETDAIARMANLCALLNMQFSLHWVGFYLVKNEELVLGPFQGPIACTRISKGKGVCGTAWEQGKTIVVPNVHEFPGHIACSSLSNAEIVVPWSVNGKVQGVLDVDSIKFDDFNKEDAEGLEKLLTLL